eukprot:COSAG01_NODE_36138_length_521_cov_5.898104_1_plen_161_part_10
MCTRLRGGARVVSDRVARVVVIIIIIIIIIIRQRQPHRVRAAVVQRAASSRASEWRSPLVVAEVLLPEPRQGAAAAAAGAGAGAGAGRSQWRRPLPGGYIAKSSPPSLRATDKAWPVPAVKSSSNSGTKGPGTSFLIGRLTGNPGPAGSCCEISLKLFVCI